MIVIILLRWCFTDEQKWPYDIQSHFCDTMTPDDFCGQLSPYQDTGSKLAKPTCGPYQLIDVACQHVNGTVVVDLNHLHKTFNIRWWILFKPCQNHWWCDLSYLMPHFIIFLLLIMIHTLMLSPHMPCLLENLFTFFTNTCHSLQCYHLSFSTKEQL
jgi:hypothetical protein